MIEKIKKFLSLVRIKEWRAFFLVFLFGFFLAKGYLFDFGKNILLFLTFFCFLTFGYLINDCFDTKEDSFDQKKINILLKSSLSFKKTFFLSLAFALLGLILVSVSGKNTFFFSLLGVLSVFLYSVPPFRLKGRPFLDLISHGFFAGLFFFLLPFFFFNQKIEDKILWLSFLIFYIFVLLEMRNHLEDYEFDKKAGLKTTVCFLGKENSEKILYFLILIFPLLSFPFFIKKSIFSSFYIFSSLLFLWFFSQNKKNYRIFDIYIIFIFILFLLM